MTRLVLIAGLGSAALLLGALAFQYLGGLAPCKMCLWQRWPHGIAIALAAAAALTGQRLIAVLGGLTVLGGAGIGVYHAGVEQGWWQGPATCSAGPVDGLSTEELMTQILNTPLVRCDEIAWSFAGLSMAGWNAALSLILAIVWVSAARRPVFGS